MSEPAVLTTRSATSSSVQVARVAQVVLPPLVFGALFFGAWELLVAVFDIQPYFLVPPSEILDRFVGNADLIWSAMRVSGANALVGLIAGAVLGAAMAFVLLRFKLLDEIVTPLSIALNAVPIFVLVAVLNNMFAITSEVPRRLMVTIVVYFVVLVNVARGLRQVEATHLELMRSYAASDWEILRLVRVPNAIAYFFTALKIAAPLAVITAFVSEYFGGSQNGLGNKITSNLATSKKAEGWAYVGGACLLGLAFYLTAVLLEIVVARRGAAGGAHRGREGA
jgi:NitT/TauT family transport system permease protein